MHDRGYLRTWLASGAQPDVQPAERQHEQHHVQQGDEAHALHCIEPDANHVHDDPVSPALQAFLGQQPHRAEAHDGRERVELGEGHRHREEHQQPFVGAWSVMGVAGHGGIGPPVVAMPPLALHLRLVAGGPIVRFRTNRCRTSNCCPSLFYARKPILS